MQLSSENKLDKSLKEKIGELKSMLSVAQKKELIKQNAEKIRSSHTVKIDDADKGEDEDDAEAQLMSHQPSGQSSSSSGTTSAQHSVAVPRRPDESVYYHPVYNPTGAPPPGQPPLYRPRQEAPFAFSQPLASGNRNMIPLAQLPPGGPIVGGQNGVPLPPPRGNVLIGGQHGIPLPPPRGNLLIGGQQGIPLPPPRLQGHVMGSVAGGHGTAGFPGPSYSGIHPMHVPPPPPQATFLNYGPQFPGSLHPMMLPTVPPPPPPLPAPAACVPGSHVLPASEELENQRTLTVNRKQAALLSVDPLDPSGVGYTARFQNPLNRKIASSTAGESAVLRVSAITDDNCHQSADGINHARVFPEAVGPVPEVESGAQTTLDDFSQQRNPFCTAPSTEPSRIYQAPAATAAAVAPPHISQTASFAAFDTGSYSIPSTEELMKRRKQMLSEVETAVGPALGAVAEAVCGHDSDPPADKNRYAHKRPAESVGNMNDKARTSLQSLLGDYSDDDDDEGAEEEVREDQTSSRMPPSKVPRLDDAAAVTGPTSYPTFNHSRPEVLQTTSVSLTPLQPVSYADLMNTYGNLAVERAAPPMPPASISASIPNNSNVPSTVSAAKPVSLPKIMKADSALTAFVPSAIRVKRSAPAPAVLISTTNTAPVVAPVVSSTKPLATSAATIKVEGAYTDFLAEIDMLQ
jgi:hypothetical protein